MLAGHTTVPSVTAVAWGYITRVSIRAYGGVMYLFKSAIIDAPVAKVWRVLRNFDSVPLWSPDIAEATIEHGRAADAVGCVRKLVLPDGSYFRETLLALSDADHSFSYDIVESPLPVSNYVATQRFTPVTTTGQTFTAWAVNFEVADEHAEEMREVVGVGIFENGFEGMKSYFEGA